MTEKDEKFRKDDMLRLIKRKTYEHRLILDDFYKHEKMYHTWDNLFIVAQGAVLTGLSFFAKDVVPSISYAVIAIAAGNLFISLIWILIKIATQKWERARIYAAMLVEKQIANLEKIAMSMGDEERVELNLDEYAFDPVKKIRSIRYGVENATTKDYLSLKPYYYKRWSLSRWVLLSMIAIAFSVTWTIILILTIPLYYR